MADAMDLPDGWMKNVPFLATLHCICGAISIAFWWFCPIFKVMNIAKHVYLYSDKGKILLSISVIRIIAY